MPRSLFRPLPSLARPPRWIVAWALVLLAASPVLAARIVVKGEVVDENGQPLAGAEVSLALAGADSPAAVDTTGEKGTFELKIDGESGSYRLRAAAPGYGTLEQDVDLEAGARVEASLPLLPAALATRQAAIDAHNAAVAALREGDTETGRARLREALETDPELPEPRLLLAQVLLDAGDAEAAIPEIERYLEARPEDEQARRVAYEAHRRAGNQEGMERHGGVLATTDAAPALARDVYNQGVGLLEAGDAEGALAKFRRAREIDPGLTPAALGIVSVLSSRGEDQAALEALAPVLEAEPENEVALRARFVILDQSESAEAEAALEAWAAQAPEAAVTWLDERAEKDFEADFLDRAEENLQRLLRLRPEEAEYHYRLGLVHAAQSRPEEAKQHLRRFLELAPEHPEAETARRMIDAL